MSSFKKIIYSYTAEDLVGLVENTFLPLCVQEIVLELIIAKLDFQGMVSEEGVSIPYIVSISNIKDLITWIYDKTSNILCEENTHINPEIGETIITKIVNTLSKEDVWSLIKDGTLLKPGEAIVKEHFSTMLNSVNDLTIQKIVSQELFQKELIDQILSCRLSLDDENVQNALSNTSKRTIKEKGK